MTGLKITALLGATSTLMGAASVVDQATLVPMGLMVSGVLMVGGVCLKIGSAWSDLRSQIREERTSNEHLRGRVAVLERNVEALLAGRGRGVEKLETRTP